MTTLEPNEATIANEEQQTAIDLVKLWFKNDDQQPFEMTPGQADIFNIIFLKRYPRNQIITCTQYGKLCSHDTPVLTTKGWSIHGDLRVGDYVFNAEGKPVKVLDTFNDGYANLEVEFSNGEKIKCHDNHEWLVKSDYHKRRGYDWQKLETKELRASLHKGYSIPHTQPIQYPKRDLTLDPYFLGAWLGDGSSDSPCVTGHPDDHAIIKKIPYKVTAKNIHKNTGIIRYSFAHQNILSELRALGVENNKHVPDIYKYSSLQDRLELLAGLIDTDGSVNSSVREKGWRNGRVYIINSNKRLIDDIAEIVTSLGIKPSITKVEPTLSSSGIQGKQPVYYLGFAPYIEIPTVLPRKKIVPVERKRNYRIKKITDITPVPGRCIEVEGGIYLVGRQLVPTHNSETIAMALLLRSITFKEDWLILAGDTKKTGIIMGKIIGHLFDNPALEQQINLEGVTSLERLKHERSQERLTWRNGGEIRILTADARNRKRVKETLTGQGARNIVQDEAALIMDDLQAMAMRMLGGFQDSFLLKIGNPFYRNHFYRTWHSQRYHKVFINYEQAMAEGRFSESFIEEMRDEPFFKELYECRFPSEDELMEGGYQRLISDELLHNALVEPEYAPKPEGPYRLGCDFAGGGNDRSAYVIRTDNLMWIKSTNRSPNTMDQVAYVQQYKNEYEIEDRYIATDAGGLGKGVGDRLHEIDIFANNVQFGQSAYAKDKYKNARAEMYYDMMLWIKNGGRIVADDNWYELLSINYKTDSERKFQIQPKDELKRRMRDRGLTASSPDVADAAALTFADSSMVVDIDDFFLG
jgi:hypothetical protein